MNRIQRTCGFCSGRGHRLMWRVTSEDKVTGIGAMESEQLACPECGGVGYKEYAVFSIEEAEAILKHCGLEE